MMQNNTKHFSLQYEAFQLTAHFYVQLFNCKLINGPDCDKRVKSTWVWTGLDQAILVGVSAVDDG